MDALKKTKGVNGKFYYYRRSDIQSKYSIWEKIKKEDFVWDVKFYLEYAEDVKYVDGEIVYLEYSDTNHILISDINKLKTKPGCLSAMYLVAMLIILINTIS